MASEWIRTGARLVRFKHHLDLTKTSDGSHARTFPSVVWPMNIQIRAQVEEGKLCWEWAVELWRNGRVVHHRVGEAKREAGAKKAALRVVSEYVAQVRAMPEVQAEEKAVIAKHAAMGYVVTPDEKEATP